MMALEAMIQQTVTAMVDKTVRSLVEQAKEDLDRQISEMVAAVSIRVLKEVSMQRYGDELRISVKLEK